MMRRLSFVVSTALVAAACGQEPAPPDRTATRPPVTVGVATAAARAIAEPLEAGGLVAASELAVISARVLAPVVAVRVRAGDRVRAGQTLVVLDDRDFAAHTRQSAAGVEAAAQGLAAARAELAAAAADETLARAWHTRMAALHRTQAATQQELDEAVARLASAGARLQAGQARVAQGTAAADAARASADAAETARSFATVTAPFDGLVTERLVDPGTMAAPGMPLLRLDGAGPARVDARVDEARIGRLQPGAAVEVWLPGATSAIAATVSEVARAADADARAFTVRVTLPRDVRPATGTFARVRFDGEARAALAVPAAALRRQGQVTSVLVVQDGAARVRLVQTGQAAQDDVEIVAGLDAGEQVIVEAPPSLTDGQRVEVRR